MRPSVAAKLRSQGGADAASAGGHRDVERLRRSSGNRREAPIKRRGRGRNSRNTTAIPSASVQAVREGGEDLLWLLLALLAITGLMVGAVTYRRHKDTNSS